MDDPIRQNIGGWPVFTRIRFELEAIDRILLPEYAGSALRGLLGHGLRKTVCITRLRDCGTCSLRTSCVYPFVFETLPKDRLQLKGADRPLPYVLDVSLDKPRSIEPGARFSFGLTLFGPACNHLAYFLQAFELAGKSGLGRGHGTFSVAEIWQQSVNEDNWQKIFTGGDESINVAPPERLRIPDPPVGFSVTLKTPLRLKYRKHLVHPETFRPYYLFWSLQRRLSALWHAYGSGDFPQIDDELLDVPAVCTLRWHDWTRYSSRQENYMQLGGLTGRIQFDAPLPQPLWNLLWLGQWVHAGKTSTMGLGGYRIDTGKLAKSDRASDLMHDQA